MPSLDIDLSEPTPLCFRRLPPGLVESLTRAQRNALMTALAQSPGSHAIDLRASIPVFGRRYYVTILAGRERRSRDRLASEGQLAIGRVFAIYAGLCALVASPILVLLLVSAALTQFAGLQSIDLRTLAFQELMHRP